MVKNRKVIKRPDLNIHVGRRDINELTIDYPVFCFKYFRRECLEKCSGSQLRDFFDRLQRLGELGWNEIKRSRRHDYGAELLPVSSFKMRLPSFITPDIQRLMVFRYNNDNYPFVAHRNGNILHILFIEANFGDVYDHG